MNQRAARAFARKARASDTPINLLAEQYGIRLFVANAKSQYGPLDRLELRRSRSRLCADKTYEEASPGIYGGWCDPFSRMAWVGDGDMAIEHNFHVLVHIVCAAPFWEPNGINSLDEEWMLMPFEHALAKACLDADSLTRVEEWQDLTYENGGTVGAARKRSFARGLLLAQRVGLLDTRLFPTFNWPDWPRLGSRLARRIPTD